MSLKNFAAQRGSARVAPAAALLPAVTACSDGSPDTTPSSAASSSASAAQEEAAAATTPSASERNTTDMGIRVTLDGRPSTPP
ncbi:hypothetical protein ACFXKG_29330 [Streptomyces sp. NPDC059255]|uniref:hypothetical protein n=1 Tax=Streptomyces sp. NPDC059255 TaxID=3346793 RepID=UPI0036BD7839